jgi:hypothetical protein
VLVYDVTEYAEPPEDEDMPIPKFSAPAAVAPDPDLRDEVTDIAWSTTDSKLLYAAHASGQFSAAVVPAAAVGPAAAAGDSDMACVDGSVAINIDNTRLQLHYLFHVLSCCDAGELRCWQLELESEDEEAAQQQ